MRLKKIKVSGIRGFNTPIEIPLDGKLISIYGPNGEGKTSLVEAIEWLLFGTIFKKDKAKSKIEYKDTIKNVIFSGTPFVEVLLDDKGTEVILRREYRKEDESKLFKNESEIEGITFQGDSDTVRPIIYQHELKNFIHTEPKDRYREFMKLLNIDAIDRFISAVRTGITSLNKNKPLRISEAYIAVQGFEKYFFDIIKKVREENVPLTKVLYLLNDKFKFSDEPITSENVDRVIEKIDLLIFDKKKKVFDIRLFDPIINYKQPDTSILSEYKPFIEAQKYILDPENKGTISEVELLDLGLKLLVGSQSEICPLCSERTITPEKIIRLKKLNQKKSQSAEKIKRNKKVIESYTQSIKKLKNEKISSLRRIMISEETCLSFESLNVPEDIRKNLSQTTKAIGLFIKWMEEWYQSFENILHNDDSSENKQKEIEIKLEKYNNENSTFNRSLEEYISNIKQTKEHIFKNLSKIEDIEELEMVGKLIRDFSIFDLINKDKEIESELRSNIKLLETYRDDLFKKRLEEHKTEIIRWYDLLNPNEEIKICDIECNPGKVNYIASYHGTKKQAVPILSEAHLNCLGLSIYLSAIGSLNNPFSFVLIDDPVQSMDNVHTTNFINEVINALLEKNFQVFILSHMKSDVSDAILERYQEYMPKLIEFYGHTLEGPKFEIKANNRFEDYINQAEKNYNGTLEQRKNSANMVRQALETYTKQYYCKKAGKKLSETYKDKNFPELDEKLLSLVEIDQAERGKLRMINRRCNQPSHDDQKVDPPTSQELRSYIDSLKGFYSKHLK